MNPDYGQYGQPQQQVSPESSYTSGLDPKADDAFVIFVYTFVQ